LDVSPVMLGQLRRNARAAKISNICAARIPETASNFPAGADVYLIVNTFHEFEDRTAHLAAVRRAMTAHSRLVIIDFLKKKTKHGPPLPYRIPLSRIVPLLRSSGFDVARVFRPNSDEYGVVARKRA
jgi:hypothetical protein